MAKLSRKPSHRRDVFPRLAGSALAWEGTDTFSTWAGYRHSAYAVLKPATGRADVTVERPTGSGEDSTPLPEQVEAYRHLREREERVSAAILTSVLSYYRRLRKWHVDAAGPTSTVPPAETAEDVRRLVVLRSVDVLAFAKGGLAYVGFAFSCRWDEEHGLGVLTHKGRVVATGEGETALDYRAAKKDGGKELRHPRP